MNFDQACEALGQGKRLKRDAWSERDRPNVVIALDGESLVMHDFGFRNAHEHTITPYQFTLDDVRTQDWFALPGDWEPTC